jgi:hypothetical protein
MLENFQLRAKTQTKKGFSLFKNGLAKRLCCMLDLPARMSLVTR